MKDEDWLKVAIVAFVFVFTLIFMWILLKRRFNRLLRKQQETKVKDQVISFHKAQAKDTVEVFDRAGLSELNTPGRSGRKDGLDKNHSF